MKSPKTLLELSGAVRSELRFERCTLVIIDAQQEYKTGRLPLVGLEKAVVVIQTLLKRARELALPIIHVMHEGAEYGLFDPRGAGFKSLDGLEPKKGEFVVLKKRPDAFSDTSLETVIRNLGADRQLLLVGFMTHMCLTATAFSALNRGLETFVVSDAVATRDLRAVNGEPIFAKQVNEVSLAALQDRVVRIVNRDEVLRQTN